MQAAGGEGGEGADERAGHARVPLAVVDEMLRLAAEALIANTRVKEHLRVSAESLHAAHLQSAALQQLTGELDHLVDTRRESRSALPARAGGPRDEPFDSLELERFDELHAISRRLVEAAADSRELMREGEFALTQLSELIDAEGRLQGEGRDLVMQTRMLPASSIEARLRRIVRQACRLTGKSVELTVEGGQTALDSQVLADLADPLMHLLRNAVDHGIEDAQTRSQAGKPAHGRIELRFSRDGFSVLVRCADDGAGIDLSRVRARALAMGLVPADRELSDEEATRLVLVQGFSTRTQASLLSGRGVGMNAIQACIADLNGSLRLHNRPGAGLTVEIRVPAALLTMHCVLVEQDGRTIAVSTQGLRDMLSVSASEIRATPDARIWPGPGGDLELVRFATCLAEPCGPPRARPQFPALVAELEDGTARAVEVDEVLQTRNVVIKGLGPHVARPPGIVGVTILGNGEIAPVVDLPRLISTASGRAPVPEPAMPAATRTGPVALVVDDSISARRSVARLLKDVGFEVQTAVDGAEALRLADARRPDVVLTDIEMPNINGFELAARLRRRPDTRRTPIVMISSRGSEKHRREASQAGADAYFVKPFSDDRLLETVDSLLSAKRD